VASRGSLQPIGQSISFGRWSLLMTGFGAVWSFLIVGGVGFALTIPVKRLAVPWMILVWASWGVGILIWWARAPFNRPAPRNRLRRIVVASFAAFSLWGEALVAGAVLLAVVSPEHALKQYAPGILTGAAVAAGAVYVTCRSMFRRVEE